jgi:hypothetical protein
VYWNGIEQIAKYQSPAPLDETRADYTEVRKIGIGTAPRITAIPQKFCQIRKFGDLRANGDP